MKNLSSRKSIRLKNYDYSSVGFYYITICTQGLRCLFGDITDGKMVLNGVGRIVNQWYLKIPQRFRSVILDEYQIMPNHLHGIIAIQNGQTHGSGSTRDGRTHGSAPTDWHPAVVGVDQCVDPIDPRVDLNPRTDRSQQTLFKTIQWFKTMTTNHYIRGVKNHRWKPFNKRLWQRNYWEHVIRTETDLNKIRQYIKNNPQMWNRDRNNPKNWKKFPDPLI